MKLKKALKHMHGRIHEWFKKDTLFRVLLVILISFFIAIQIHAIIRDYRRGERNEQKSSYDEVIQPWMTFEYINHVFNLSPHYLQDVLSITDQSYPNIQISRYAREHHVDVAIIMQKIFQAVKSHLK